MIKLILVLLTFLPGLQFQTRINQEIPIYFAEYDITILEFPKYGDTLYYNKSGREDFKFVFFNEKGESYCERYLDKRLYEKGRFINSLDTLKKYVSGRSSNGDRSPITIEKYFQPLRDGNWFIYKNEKIAMQVYARGILQK